MDKDNHVKVAGVGEGKSKALKMCGELLVAGLWRTLELQAVMEMGNLAIEVLPEELEVQTLGVLFDILNDNTKAEDIEQIRNIISAPDIESIVKLLSQKRRSGLDIFQSSIDSVTLIVAHAMLDSAVTQFLRISRELDPDSWVKDILNKKITVSEHLQDMSSGQQTAIADKLDKVIDELSRDALVKRIEILFSKCPPPSEWPTELAQMKTFQFDKNAINELDLLRQDLLHRPFSDTTIEDARSKVWLLLKTALYLFTLVLRHFNIKAIDAVQHPITEA